MLRRSDAHAPAAPLRRATRGSCTSSVSFKQELEGIADADENHRDILRVIDFGQKANRAYLDWCRETKEYFEQKRQATGETRTDDPSIANTNDQE